MRIRILLVTDADPDPTFCLDADPDPSVQIKVQNLENVLKKAHSPYGTWVTYLGYLVRNSP